MLSSGTSALLLLICWWAFLEQCCQALHNGFREDMQPHPSLEDTAFYATDEEHRHFVSATLGSNMVLQRDRPAIIWGFSQPGATITTVLQKGHYDPYPALTTTADSTGLWRQPLQQIASRVPHTIDIRSTTGESAFLDNVLFGDVYICSGQSNMQFTLDGTTNGEQEAKEGNNYPHIRLFTVGQLTSSPGKELLDLQTVEQQWTVANEQSLYSYGDKYFAFGYFSSVCWFFGKQVADGLDNQVPIGLISSNWGGTKVELWQVGGYLYNAMIHPYMVGPMALAGFTWYQGEANAENQTTADSYAQTFPQMIQQWRKGFQSPNLYFGFVQLSTWCPPQEPEGVAMLRQAQMAAMALPNVGYATNADHGWGCDVHPPPKQFCGKRLANSALALQGGCDCNHRWKSPSYAKSSKSVSVHWDPELHKYQVSHMATIDLIDVSSKGLYMLETPYNSLNGTLDCSKLIAGTCAWASIKMAKAGWVNATVSIQAPDKVVLTVTSSSHDDVDLSQDDTVEATSYGWGSVPMMTLYDAGSDLPVLPWKEHIGTSLRLQSEGQAGKAITVSI